MRTRHYTDLHCWQRGMALAKTVYELTADFPSDEKYGLRSQLRRAAVSVPSNLAEGQGRELPKSFALFVTQARGSLYEMETQIRLAKEFGFVSAQDCTKTLSECEELARMMNALLSTLRKRFAPKPVAAHKPTDRFTN